MKHFATFNSRYGTPRHVFIEQIEEGSQKGVACLVMEEVLSLRSGWDEQGNVNMLDPDGGPYLTIGTRLYGDSHDIIITGFEVMHNSVLFFHYAVAAKE